MFVLTALAGCVATPADLEQDKVHEVSSDAFNRHFLVPDEAFVDAEAVSEAAVQAFLEHTPFGGVSFLARELVDGEPFSTALSRIARGVQINPIVLLATLQKEQGFVSRSERPLESVIEAAFGCGCHDRRPCIAGYAGLGPQLACAARHLREGFDAGSDRAPTRSGLLVGGTFRDGSGLSVTLSNRATLSLYTYTPWVLEGAGGNWLFWTLWQRFCQHFGYLQGMSTPFNEGFIGGSCTNDIDCFYDNGWCALGPDGRRTCTLACERICPDRPGPGWAITHCDRGTCAAP